jgi:hypothetical protein
MERPTPSSFVGVDSIALGLQARRVTSKESAEICPSEVLNRHLPEDRSAAALEI